MRRCASRKKSRESISSAAWLNASLWIRIAPSTDFSASRLCGSVRSAGAVAVSGIAGEKGTIAGSAGGGRMTDRILRLTANRQPQAENLFRFGDHRDLHLGGD